MRDEGEGRSEITLNGDLFVEETNYGRTLYFNSDGSLRWSHLNRSENGKLMFIGTKRAASDIVKKYSDLTSMPYVNNRWLGGLLTNFNTIRKSISKLEDLRTKLKNQKIYNLSKKQIIDLKRDIERLEKNLLGVQNLTKLPDAIFVIDTRYERIAIQEANKLNIPVIALVDSNNSYDGVDYMIPANDDAMSSIDLFLKSISVPIRYIIALGSI